MPNITAPALQFPNKAFPAQQAGAPAGIVGDLLFSEIMPKYATLAKSQKVFYTSAPITSPASFVTAIQGGPMLWNKPGSGIDAHILAIGVGVTTATNGTATGAIGWASNAQTTQPTSPTSITAVNAYAGGGASALAGGAAGAGGVLSVGTVIVLPAPIFLPLIGINGAAVSINVASANWVDIGGALIVGPGTVGYVCGSAVLTSLVAHIGIVWAELPA